MFCRTIVITNLKLTLGYQSPLSKGTRLGRQFMQHSASLDERQPRPGSVLSGAFTVGYSHI